ncbi:MAG: NAD(P)-dependent oxidoreductase [Pseudomonadales bacterium]|nr:NAD(P)-dependent oxidoreductase [Pseudomonadales bacterium]
MKYLVTGSAGHLGEGLVRTLERSGHEVLGLDIKASPFTACHGSITDRGFVQDCLQGVDVVCHTATLHKPHVVTHSMQDFIDTNVSGTLCLLESAVQAGVGAFVFTSTTSVYGEALRPPVTEPAAWVTESLAPVPKNIYGVTKLAAEGICHLVHKRHGLPVVILRTSRFFPEEDDNAAIRAKYSDDNIKANEYLYRRVDVQDVVDAQLCAAARAPEIGFGRYIITATTPLKQRDLRRLRGNAPEVVAQYVPHYRDVYQELGWQMFDDIERVYVNERARVELGWSPQFDFAGIVRRLARGEPTQSQLALEIGAKGYHDEAFEEGPFPVESDP